jgi:hypothetical protein
VNHPTDDESEWWARGLKSSAVAVALKGPDQVAAHGRRHERILTSLMWDGSTERDALQKR